MKQTISDILQGYLTPTTETVFRRRMSKSTTCHSNNMGDLMFQVTDGNAIYSVDIRSHTCTCGKWRSSGIPCRHAIATESSMGYVELLPYGPCLSMAPTYKDTYLSEFVNPLLPPINWELPNPYITVLPPVMRL